MFLPPNSNFCAIEDLISYCTYGKMSQWENTSENPVPDKHNNYFSVFSPPRLLQKKSWKSLFFLEAAQGLY